MNFAEQQPAVIGAPPPSGKAVRFCSNFPIAVTSPPVLILWFVVITWHMGTGYAYPLVQQPQPQQLYPPGQQPPLAYPGWQQPPYAYGSQPYPQPYAQQYPQRYQNDCCWSASILPSILIFLSLKLPISSSFSLYVQLRRIMLFLGWWRQNLEFIGRVIKIGFLRLGAWWVRFVCS